MKFFSFVSSSNYYTSIDIFLYSLITLVPILIVVAFFTLLERQVLGQIQRRIGPDVVGNFGSLQPFADALKLIVKEISFPSKINKILFIIGPSLTLLLSFLGWIVISFDLYSWIINLNNSFLLNLVLSSFGVYGILFSCWASNCKYSILAGLRVVAQMLSYEVFLSLLVIPIFAFTGSSSFNEIIMHQQIYGWNIFFFWPIAFIFFIAIIAETNRIPFDLVEAEAELVAGYNVEYSGITFAFFFLGEYANILQMSSWFVILFLGGGSYCPWLIDSKQRLMLFKFNNEIYTSINCQSLSIIYFAIKVIMCCWIFVFIRGALPRVRFDQLMYIGWKILLPLSLSFIFFYCNLLISFNSCSTKFVF